MSAAPRKQLHFKKSLSISEVKIESFSKSTFSEFCGHYVYSAVSYSLPLSFLLLREIKIYTSSFFHSSILLSLLFSPSFFLLFVDLVLFQQRSRIILVRSRYTPFCSSHPVTEETAWLCFAIIYFIVSVSALGEILAMGEILQRRKPILSYVLDECLNV